MSALETAPAYTLPPAPTEDGRPAPRWPLYAVFIAAAVTSVVVLVRGLAAFVPDMPTVVAVAVLAFAAYTLFWAWLLGRADMFLPLSGRAKTLAFLWGGVASTGIAIVANQVIGPYSAYHLGPAWATAFGGPFTEEALKGVGIAVVLLLMAPRPRTALEGLLVGAWVGLGFQVVEDVVLTMVDASSLPEGQRDDLIVIVNSLANRVLLFGWFSHVTFSAIAGFGIGYFFTRRTSAGRRWLVMVGMILLAWLGHFVWNAPVLSFLGPISMLIQGVPFLLLLLYLVKVGRREESAAFLPYLGWVDPPVVTPDQRDALESPQTRRAARKASGDARGEKRRQRLRSSLAVAVGTRDAAAADAAITALGRDGTSVAAVSAG